MKTKTIEVSRWTCAVSEGECCGVFTCKENAENMIKKYFPKAMLVELKGSYEIEVPDRVITLTKSELSDLLCRHMPSNQERINGILNTVFGGGE